MPRRSRPWKDIKPELLRDPAFRQAYEELGPEFQAARAVIALRAVCRLTQAQLAARARLQRPVLSRIEGAKAMPTIPTLERLAAALNAKVEIRFLDRRNHPLPHVPSIRVGGTRAHTSATAERVEVPATTAARHGRRLRVPRRLS